MRSHDTQWGKSGRKRGKLGARRKGHFSLSSSVPFHPSRGPVCRVWVWKARGKRDAGSGRWDYKSALHICVLVYARGWSKRTVCASERRQWLASRFLAFIFVCVRGCEWSKHVRGEGFWQGWHPSLERRHWGIVGRSRQDLQTWGLHAEAQQESIQNISVSVAVWHRAQRESKTPVTPALFGMVRKLGWAEPVEEWEQPLKPFDFLFQIFLSFFISREETVWVTLAPVSLSTPQTLTCAPGEREDSALSQCEMGKCSRAPWWTGRALSAQSRLEMLPTLPEAIMLKQVAWKILKGNKTPNDVIERKKSVVSYASSSKGWELGFSRRFW